MRPSLAIREALLDAFALLLPVDCAGCGARDRALCPSCRERLRPAPLHAEVPGVLPVMAGAPYRDPLRRVMLASKEGRTELAAALAPLLIAAIEQARPTGEFELCPVPSTRAAFRRRGYDPVLVVLARAGLRSARVLRPAGAHRVQKGLGRVERRRNLHGVHRARHPLTGRRFLLVDDVVTTGATLAEAARAIREAGGEVVGAVAIAATPRRAV